MSTATKPSATPSATSAPTEKTTLEIDAGAVAKIRSSLRAIRYPETIEEFVSEMFVDMLDPDGGFFEGLIQRRHEHRREEIEAVLDRVRSGDKSQCLAMPWSTVETWKGWRELANRRMAFRIRFSTHCWPLPWIESKAALGALA